jgi:hypothetical protein
MSVAILPAPRELLDTAELSRRIADTPGKPCDSRDPEDYFPLETTSTSRARQLALVPIARALCEGCPVIAECDRLADERGERFAIAGGRTPWQRRGLL